MSTTTIADKFVRTDDFAARIDGVCLPDEAWAVFAQLELPASAEEIAPQVGQSLDAVMESITALLQHGLIRKKLRNWREFCAQQGTKKPTTAPVAQAAAAGRPGAALAGWPKPAAPQIDVDATDAPTIAPTPTIAPAASVTMDSAAPAPAATAPPPLFTDYTPPRAEISTPPPAAILPTPAPKPRLAAVPTAVAPTISRTASETVLPVSFSIANEKARLERRATAAMTISFRIAAVKAAAKPASWKLNPLLKAIVQKGGGGLPGQLLVYRVFIHVPAEMMHAAGIQSLSLVDDSVVIRDQAFYDALCQAARAVASIDLRTVNA